MLAVGLCFGVALLLLLSDLVGYGSLDRLGWWWFSFGCVGVVMLVTCLLG